MSRLMRVTCDICGTTETYDPRIRHTSMFDIWPVENDDVTLDICQECINKMKDKAKEISEQTKDDHDEPVPVIKEMYRKFEIYPGDSESVFSDIASAYENNPEISYLDMVTQVGLVQKNWPFPEEWDSIGWRKMPVCKFMDDPKTNKTFITISEPNKFVK